MFSGIDEPKIPSRDRVSISPRSCVDFDRCAQAEIVCRFRRDRVSISPGDRLGFVGCRLRFMESSPRWRIVGEREISTEGVDPDCVKGSSRKSATRDDGRNSRKQTAAAVLAEVGRPVRSTDVHDVHRSWSGRPARSTDLEEPATGRIGRPFRSTDRKLKVTGRIGRPSRSTDLERSSLSVSIGRPVRSTDRRVWAKICCSAKCGAASI